MTEKHLKVIKIFSHRGTLNYNFFEISSSKIISLKSLFADTITLETEASTYEFGLRT